MLLELTNNHHTETHINTDMSLEKNQDNFYQNLGFNKHDNGYYWQELTPKYLPFEIVLIGWMPGEIGSLAHDHLTSLAIATILPIGGENLELEGIYHRVSKHQLIEHEKQLIKPGEIHFVMPYQIHEIVNKCPHTVFAIHVYFPRRHF